MVRNILRSGTKTKVLAWQCPTYELHLVTRTIVHAVMVAKCITKEVEHNLQSVFHKLAIWHCLCHHGTVHKYNTVPKQILRREHSRIYRCQHFT